MPERLLKDGLQAQKREHTPDGPQVILPIKKFAAPVPGEVHQQFQVKITTKRQEGQEGQLWPGF